MVKSFHKKRKNFKNKTKRNKKMIGGEIGENINHFGEDVIFGFRGGEI